MPNFITKEVKGLNLPFIRDSVEFLQLAKGRNLDLILVRNNGEEFFIAIKKKQNEFIIKGEKVTKPAKIGLLQQSLKIFEQEFCGAIKSRSFGVNPNKLLQNNTLLSTHNELLQRLAAHKFKKLFIEIGFGSGRHLLHQASNNQDTLVVGIEIYKPAILQVTKLALRSNLDNILLTNSDARVFLSMQKSNSIDKIFLHFPVPWDDAPHRRVVSSEFAKECQRALKVGGKFELRSDSKEYAGYTTSKFLELQKPQISIWKDKNLEISSKYEDRWKRQEKEIFDVVFLNSEDSTELKIGEALEFKELNPHKIYKNFKNETFKFDDFFIHFEEKYTISEDEILLKVSFGAFDMPQRCYIKITFEKSGYLITQPLETKENFKAHKKIEEILNLWQT